MDDQIRVANIPVVDIDCAMNVIAPYIDGVWSDTSRQGKQLKRKRFKNLLHMTARFLLRKLSRNLSSRGSEADVRAFYETAHASVEFTGYRQASNHVTYLYRGQVLSLSGMGNYRLKSGLLTQILEQLHPRSVCEAGCGRIRHLAYFSPKFPEINFSGFDISENAISFGKYLQGLETFDPNLPERPGDVLSESEMQCIRAVNLFQASAANLSCVEDNAFDLVYTVSALEQMNAILPAVLKELHRVTRRYVVFFEPFADANGFFEKTYLWAGNYFHIKSADLERYGFRPLLVVPLPTKPSFADCLVVAEKM